MGKSCLSLQATKKKFENNYLATVGFEFFAFNIRIDGKVVKLQIWDTCGQEIYRSLISSFYIYNKKIFKNKIIVRKVLMILIYG